MKTITAILMLFFSATWLFGQGLTIGTNYVSAVRTLMADGKNVGLQFGPQTTWLVFDGDSLTAGTGAATQTYPYVLTNSILTNAWIVSKTNAAISGSKVSDRINAYTNYVRPFMPDATHDSVVFFWCGINDLVSEGASAATTFARLTNYWGIARADGFKICAFTVMDYGNTTIAKHKARFDLNLLIRDNPTLYDWLVDADELIPVIYPVSQTSDGIHPDNEVSAYLGRQVADVLRNQSQFSRASRYMPMLGGTALRIMSTANSMDNNGRAINCSMILRGTVPIATFEDDTGDDFVIYSYGGSTKLLWKDGLGNVSPTTDNYLEFGTAGLTVSKPLTSVSSSAWSIGTGSVVTLGDTNEVYLINVDAQTATLPTAVGKRGRTYTIKTIAPAATGTVATTSSQTIDGSTTYSLSASNKFVRVISDNAAWWVIGNN